MSREHRIGFGCGCILLGLTLLTSETEWLFTIALGLLGTGIVQFIRLPKDNVLPFRRRPH